MKTNGPRISPRALIRQEDTVLVTVNQDQDGLYYLLPGGGQEPFEDLHTTLIREMLEEVGAEVEIGDIVYVREYINHDDVKPGFPPFHQVEVIFRCQLKGEPQTATNPDTLQSGWMWMPIGELLNVTFFPQSIARALNGPGGEKIYVGVTD